MTHDEQKLVDDLLLIESGLTGWEMDFLDNLDNGFRERALSERQRDRLNDIAEKCGLGGIHRRNGES